MPTDYPLMDPLLVDRSAHRRESVDPAASFAIVVRDGAVMVKDGRLVERAPGDHPESSLAVYLGRHADRDFVALVPAADPAATVPGASTAAEFDVTESGARGEYMIGLRDAFLMFSAAGTAGERDRELAATAVAITTWHANHPHCALCGEPTRPTSGGWVRRCDTDERDHYPRTDPAVIVAITDQDDRLLMAHASYWSAGRFSHLAGYVEPGESFEQAVHREVFEEAALTVHDLVYVGSQPWPFPASIMVGFTARVDDPHFTLDQDEITEARFVSRAELASLVADGTMIVAPAGSIARRMMEDWYGGPIG
ncbi:NAD(+) diphosphatase [Demequina aurantiaca]|uniref:NAD(+) diphosphatase n=1 Tax=Demequina aurantiaca TaxID=676200 RepID=UPI003D33827F